MSRSACDVAIPISLGPDLYQATKFDATASRSMPSKVHARAMASETARSLGIDPREVVVCSTGVIGKLLPMDAVAQGIAHRVVRHDYGGIAAGWAREDTTGFVKILADPDSGQLLGVHVIGPEAATVIQPAIQAMSFGQTAHEVATGQYWIHPALTEVLENALLKV